MEREIQSSLIKTSEKQWPDFNGEDVKLMKDFKSHVEILQTTINLLSCIEMVESIDVQKALENRDNMLALKSVQDKETIESWNSDLVSCDLNTLIECLFDEEVIDLIKTMATLNDEVNQGREIIRDYAEKLDQSIQDLKSIYRIKTGNH